MRKNETAQEGGTVMDVMKGGKLLQKARERDSEIERQTDDTDLEQLYVL